MNDLFCECCGAKTVKYKHTINKWMVDSLYQLFMAGGKEHVKNLNLSQSQFNNFQKLQYWKLTEKVAFNGELVKGVWSITDHGRNFITRGAPITKSVWTYRNKFVSFEGDTIFFKDIHEKQFRQSEQYWDEARPLV